MEDGLVIFDGKWMKDTNDSTMPNDSTPLWKPLGVLLNSSYVPLTYTKLPILVLAYVTMINYEEDPQEDEDDMEIDIEEDENEPELTYPYKEVDPLNPLSPASESDPDDEIEVENTIEHEDETIPVSIYKVGESSTATIPQEDGDRLLPGFMRRDIDSLFGRMVNFSRRLCGHETAHALVENKGEAKDRFYGKLTLDLGNEVRSSVEQGTA
ncbi:hypothetical protein Tco_0476349, partial [Tanacetum coccineum]